MRVSEEPQASSTKHRSPRLVQAQIVGIVLKPDRLRPLRPSTALCRRSSLETPSSVWVTFSPSFTIRPRAADLAAGRRRDDHELARQMHRKGLRTARRRSRADLATPASRATRRRDRPRSRWPRAPRAAGPAGRAASPCARIAPRRVLATGMPRPRCRRFVRRPRPCPHRGDSRWLSVLIQPSGREGFRCGDTS